MDRVKYIAEMKNLLSFMEPRDRVRVLRYYEQQFDAAGDEGEQALIRSLGSPVRQVLMVEKQYREREEKGIYGVENAPAAEEQPPFTPDTPAYAPAPAAEYTDESREELRPELPRRPYQPMREQPGSINETRIERAAEQEIRQAFGVNEEPAEYEEEAYAEEEYDEYEETPVRRTQSERVQPAAQEQAPGGRVAAAVLLTPLILLLVLVGLAVALALGAVALAPAFALGAAAVYLGLYALQNLHYLPDMLAVVGVAVVSAGVALFFAWLGIWLIAEGIALLVRMVGGIYQKLLHGGANNG